MRKVLFWLHLVAALTAGIVIVIMSLTGTALMYEKQMIASADGYVIDPPENAAPVSAEALLAAASAARPGLTPTSIAVSRNAGTPASVSFGREGTVFLDPYRASVLGEGSTSARRFFRSMTDWHRWLAMSGDTRPTGRAITGASNLLFLFVVLSGLVIWWPKVWSKASLKSILFFRRGLSGKPRDFNWHNVIGFWSAIPLAFVVASGATISYPWASDLLYRMAGTEPPPRPPAPAAPGSPTPASAPRAERPKIAPVSFIGLDPILRASEARVPEWRTLTIRFTTPDAPVTVGVDTSTGAQRPDLRSTLTFERATAALTREETYASQTRGRQWRTWARWIHTGEAFGIPGQTIAGLVSFGAVVLAWTGVALSWRRFRAWRARRRQPAIEPVAADAAVGAA